MSPVNLRRIHQYMPLVRCQVGGLALQGRTRDKPLRTVGIRVLNTCLYQGFRADLADREEAKIR